MNFQTPVDYQNFFFNFTAPLIWFLKTFNENMLAGKL